MKFWEKTIESRKDVAPIYASSEDEDELQKDGKITLSNEVQNEHDEKTQEDKMVELYVSYQVDKILLIDGVLNTFLF